MSEGRKRLADEYKTRRMSALFQEAGHERAPGFNALVAIKGGGRAEKALRGTADDPNTSELLAGFRQILCDSGGAGALRALDQPCRSTSRNERALQPELGTVSRIDV
jgi:hypothetical protein